MRWIVLLISILSFNSYASNSDITIWSNVKESAQNPFAFTLIPFYLSSVTICYPLSLTPEAECAYFGVHIIPKIVRAKPDATIYLASDGEIKAAYLEEALIILRKEYPNASDMKLAKAILAY